MLRTASSGSIPLLRIRRMFSLRSTALKLRNDGLLVDLCGRQVAGSGKGKRDLVNGRGGLSDKLERADLAVRNGKAYVVPHQSHRARLLMNLLQLAAEPFRNLVVDGRRADEEKSLLAQRLAPQHMALVDDLRQNPLVDVLPV